MKYCKLMALAFFVGNLSACTVFLGEPAERVSDFTDVDLCIQLADKTFKFHPQWHWAITDEIKKRKLDESKRCETTYNNRTERLLRKLKVKPISFKEALELN